MLQKKIIHYGFVALLLFMVGCGSDGSEPSESEIDTDLDGVVNANDCAPEDKLKWNLVSYVSVDADNDGFKVNSHGEICTNDSLPASYYSESASNDLIDCDDDNSNIWRTANVYSDLDGDGLGAGAALPTCIGESPEINFSLVGDDCAPADDNKWQLLNYTSIDADADGFKINSTGTVCTGNSLPDYYYSTQTANTTVDCDDVDANVWRMVTVYVDLDGDGVGSGRGVLTCIGKTTGAGYSIKGYDPNDNPNDPEAVNQTDFDLPNYIQITIE